MAPPALPAPTTMVRPLGGGGRCLGSTRLGSAASTAARNMARRSSFRDIVARAVSTEDGRSIANSTLRVLRRRLSGADLVPRHHFERTHHRGMIPLGAAF